MLRLALFLFALLFTLSGADRSYPQNVEVDLIFPRNDTYRAIYPFPIVFAIRNAAAIWPFNFEFQYSLDVWDPVQGRFKYGHGGFEDNGHFPNSNGLGDQEYPEGWDDPLLVINATTMVTNMTDTWGVVRWSIGLSRNCTKDVPPDDTVSKTQPIFQGSVQFSLSDDAPVPFAPNFTLPRCPQLVGTYEIEDEMDVEHRDGVGTCAILAEEQPQGDPCGLGLDLEHITTRVSQTMLDFVNCEKGTWPNPTATDCAQLGGASSQRPGLIRLFLTLGLACMWSFL
ncbi:hypothetical protein VTO42DRAFT_1741 [Malbranchea cinnamomea]